MLPGETIASGAPDTCANWDQAHKRGALLASRILHRHAMQVRPLLPESG